MCQQLTQPEGITATLLLGCGARGGERGGRSDGFELLNEELPACFGVRFGPLRRRVRSGEASCTVNPADYVVGEGEPTGSTDPEAAGATENAVAAAAICAAFAPPMPGVSSRADLTRRAREALRLSPAGVFHSWRHHGCRVVAGPEGLW